MGWSIHIVSLPRAAARRAHMAREAERLGLDIRFFDAVDGRTLGPDALAGAGFTLNARMTGPKPLTPGETACYMSHVLAIRQLLTSGDNWRLICEDDVVFADDLPAILAAIDRLPPVWDVIKLGGLKPNAPHPVAPLTAERSLRRPMRLSLGAHAYAVSRRGAQRLVPACSHINDAFDGILDRYWITGINLLEVAPWPAHQSGALPSDIEELAAGGRWENHLPQWKKTAMSLRRRIAFALRRARDRRDFPR